LPAPINRRAATLTGWTGCQTLGAHDTKPHEAVVKKRFPGGLMKPTRRSVLKYSAAAAATGRPPRAVSVQAAKPKSSPYATS
jgi:hypothetical protein